jgi:hypothetical protein
MDKERDKMASRAAIIIVIMYCSSGGYVNNHRQKS